MFSKKCTVVGSLLVMAAQTATAVTCASITGSSTPTLAVLCASPTYTGDLETPTTQNCVNNPCSGDDAATCCDAAANCNELNNNLAESNPTLDTVCADTALYVKAVTGGVNYCAGTTCQTTDAATCCVTRSTCTGMAGAKSTICGQNGFSGEYISGVASVKCAGATCNNNDAAACCEPAALCNTITSGTVPSLATVCSDPSVAEALIAGAFCAGTACAESDEAACCAQKAYCSTAIVGDICNDAAYQLARIDAASSTRCAGAACALVDRATCCKPAASKAKCSSITAAGSTTLICGGDGLNSANANSDCDSDTCGTGDKSTCCNVATTCTSDYDKGDNMVASGAGTARGTTIKFTCDSGYAATNNGDATCQIDGDWEGGECEKVTPTCSVTDGSKATPWTGGTAGYEQCTCTGAAKKCSTLNVCDVAKKTCVCTPGKDHWCYEDAEHSFAIKFGCMADGSEFKGWKCVGDNVLEAKYSNGACTVHIKPADDGEDQTFSATKKTKVQKGDGDDATKTDEDTTVTGISTCKGGVAGAGATPPGPAPGPAPGAAAPGPSGNAEFDAGSVAQCSTLAMLMVVAAMWAGRN